MAKHEFHMYASTKTTAQLFLDLAAAISHSFTLYVLMNMTERGTTWDILFYMVIITISLQAILAIGLFILRLMALNHGHGNIPLAAKYLNNIAFWGCIFVAVLEVGIAALEKLALDGKHSRGDKDCPAVPLI